MSPPKSVKAGREIRNSLIDLGVCKRNGRDTLRGYVTLPIRVESGNVIGIHGYEVDRYSQGLAVIVAGEELSTNHTNGERVSDGLNFGQ